MSSEHNTVAIHVNKQERWFYTLAVLALLAGIAVFSYTHHYWAIGIPFVIPFTAWIILNWKSFYWFYVICIPLTVITQVGGSSMMYLPQLPLTILMAGIVIALLLYHKRILPENLIHHPITLIIFLQYIWLIVSVMFSQIPLYSIKYLGVNTIQLLVFFILPAIVLQTKKDIFTLAKVFLIPMTLLALFVFARHAYFKFGYVETNLVVKPFFYNHVDHACVMSMVLPVFYILWRYNKGNKRLRLLYLGLFLFYFLGMYLAFARAAMLGTIFAFIIAWAIRKKLVNWFMPLFFTFCFVVIGLMSYNNKYIDFRPDFKQTYTRHTFNDLIKASFVGGDMSSAERFFRWIAAVRMSEEHPLVGVGPNNFYYYYKPHAVTIFKTYVSSNPEKSTTHNYFLFMLVEQGWPAMVLYGLLISALFYHAQKLYHRTEDKLYRALTLTSAMIVAAFFLNNLFSELLQTYRIGAIFYFAVLLLYWVDRQIKKEQKELPA
ncbi:O-antigen ligase family protein [Edaphocola aurantiacus]|uniref:O-antigen ligase family protein n=1 Tax=Edaphocola aurantiacus TaxID=2601682 RepID=UPI001C9669C9|nr:O-antigen ligase family protein [Edaphocola aurantiacus]